MSLNDWQFFFLPKLVDDYCTAHNSSAYDYSFMPSGLGWSMVSRLSCYSTRKKCATILSTHDGKKKKKSNFDYIQLFVYCLSTLSEWMRIIAIVCSWKCVRFAWKLLSTLNIILVQTNIIHLFEDIHLIEINPILLKKIFSGTNPR